MIRLIIQKSRRHQIKRTPCISWSKSMPTTTLKGFKDDPDKCALQNHEIILSSIMSFSVNNEQDLSLRNPMIHGWGRCIHERTISNGVAKGYSRNSHDRRSSLSPKSAFEGLQSTLRISTGATTLKIVIQTRLSDLRNGKFSTSCQGSSREEKGYYQPKYEGFEWLERYTWFSLSLLRVKECCKKCDLKIMRATERSIFTVGEMIVQAHTPHCTPNINQNSRQKHHNDIPCRGQSGGLVAKQAVPCSIRSPVLRPTFILQKNSYRSMFVTNLGISPSITALASTKVIHFAASTVILGQFGGSQSLMFACKLGLIRDLHRKIAEAAEIGTK